MSTAKLSSQKLHALRSLSATRYGYQPPGVRLTTLEALHGAGMVSLRRLRVKPGMRSNKTLLWRLSPKGARLLSGARVTP